MNILTHKDSSIIGSFATDTHGYCVNIEFSNSEATKVSLSTSTSQDILYSEIDDKLVLPISIDTDFVAFLFELVEQRQPSLALPFLVEKAALLVENFKSISTPAQFYLSVAGEGQSKTFDFCAKKVTLERN